MTEKSLAGSAIGQVLELLKPYRLHVFLAVILALLPAYFTLWSPYVTGRLIDDGILAGNIPVLLWLGFLILGIKIILFAMNSSVTYCMSAFGLQILVDYRDKLLKKVLSYPFSFFDKISSGSLTTRLTSDINSVQELFSTALVPLIGNLFLIAGVMVAMLVIQWKLALLALSIVPVLIWLTMVFNERIRRRFGFLRKNTSSLNSFAGEIFSGNREIRVLGAHDAVEAEFESHSRRLSNRSVRAVREYALFNPLIPFLTAIMDVMIVGYGGFQVYQGTMTVGEVVSFLGYSALFAWPVRDFAEKYTVLQQALASVDRLVEISNHEAEPDEGEREFSGSAEFEVQDLSFSYQGTETPAVRSLNFKVKAGEKIALMGETGSGKTTTCSLLMRFYQAQSGSILLNGIDLRDYSLESYRLALGWVSQDVFLFSWSLRENLSFGTNVSDEEIWKILEIVQLKEWVENLPEQLNEVFVERASLLSSGQRQLISLARALLRKPRILIFDEATSYVDSLTEFMFQKALEKLWQTDLLKDVTCFFIAHRLSTLRKCDRMLVFKGGKIVEEGSYSDLVASGGYAAGLFSQQFKKRQS